MKRLTIKQFTKKAQDILKANNVNVKCLLVSANMFTHADGTVNFDFSINANSVYIGKSPEEALAKLAAAYTPKFADDIVI